MTRRPGPSAKIRFEIFKRDAFTCQYCGAKAPDVILHVDHIEPMSRGGNDSLLNLLTSCAACNGGKGATPLDDSSMVQKQRRQLEDLQERREQIDMLVDWQRGLGNVDDHATDRLSDYWSGLVPGWSVTANGKIQLRKSIRKYGIDGVMLGMRVAVDERIVIEGDPPKASADSVAKAWDFFPRICAVRAGEKTKPWLQRVFYIRAICRNRQSSFKEHDCLRLLNEAAEIGVDLNELERLAKMHTSRYGWECAVDDAIASAAEKIAP